MQSQSLKVAPAFESHVACLQTL